MSSYKARLTVGYGFEGYITSLAMYDAAKSTDQLSAAYKTSGCNAICGTFCAADGTCPGVCPDGQYLSSGTC